ncbi:MAG TPA: tetratricopeptide repeat protein [Kofleriaceae bacterium]|jgi:tetratricopeptide (TPR) repeat protein
MRRVLLFVALAACGAPAAHPAMPAAPAIKPADDIAIAKPTSPSGDAAHDSTLKDPRVVDLDIIRIRATSTGVGGEPELTSVASSDLFRAATDAAKAGSSQDAIGRYRQLVHEFPDSQYAPVSLFNIAALYDKRGEIDQTIAALRELIATYPQSHESIEGHLYIVALQSDKAQWSDALATLAEVLARPNLTFADRIEAFARKGYVLLALDKLDDAEIALQAAVAEWRKAPHIDDPYYIAMAQYYRGEIQHHRFTYQTLRTGDDDMVADLEKKRTFAVAAYDLWKESLQFRSAYWATASGYQMSQIFVELWEAHVKAPYPKHVALEARPTYVAEVHARVKEHLQKALEGHRMNIELAKAYGVDTEWSRASTTQSLEIQERLAKEASGLYEKPAL